MLILYGYLVCLVKERSEDAVINVMTIAAICSTSPGWPQKYKELIDLAPRYTRT